jgi:hypothetical protein
MIMTSGQLDHDGITQSVPYRPAHVVTSTTITFWAARPGPVALSPARHLVGDEPRGPLRRDTAEERVPVRVAPEELEDARVLWQIPVKLPPQEGRLGLGHAP